jgi:hypothetical protein
MQIGTRFRCYPTPAQEQTLLQWIGCQRFVYNAKVGEDRYFRCFARKALSHTGEFAPIDRRWCINKTINKQQVTPNYLCHMLQTSSSYTTYVISQCNGDFISF